MIPNQPIGADLTILNTYYSYPKKDEKTGKYNRGYLDLVYRDNTTGEKECLTIDDPDYEFYFANDDENIEHNLLFIEKERVHKEVVPYVDLLKVIAEKTGNTNFYFDNIKSGNRYANNQLHMHPKVFMSDMNIEDHYRFRFGNLYTNNLFKPTKSYLDIEVDTKYMMGDFPEYGECPINAVTVIDEKNDNVYTFILRDSKNPLIEQFEKSVSKDLFDELKMFVRENVGGWKDEIRFGLDKFNYNFIFYDEEIKLIHDIFILINSSKPDFVLAWNMAFDIPYIIERIKVLGYNPEDIMCHPDFKHKVAEYFIDTRMENEFAERGDFAKISSYSVYLDQMIHFASRRKGQSAFSSFSLDYIGGLVAKVRKLDYSHITTDLSELPYLDFKTFIFYNIFDTIVQKCVEEKVGDIDYIFNKCLINNTRYQKGHRQTVYLVNRGTKEFYNDGLIIGNNMNKGNPKPEVKFAGAFVGDPNQINDYSKLKLHGHSINVFDNLDDFDYSSLYPSIMSEFNISHNTQIGKLFIPAEEAFKNKHGYTELSRESAFIEDLQSHVYLEFGERWLGLASYGDLLKDVETYFSEQAVPTMGLRYYDKNGFINPVVIGSPGHMVNPITVDRGLINPIHKVHLFDKEKIGEFKYE